MAGELALFTVDGELVSRTEVFDEEDLEAALARFDQLSQPTPRLENAAGQGQRALQANVSGPRLGPWPKDTGGRISSDDRRRVVGAGIRQGAMPRSRISGRSLKSGANMTLSHRDPRCAPRPHSCPRRDQRPKQIRIAMPSTS